MKKVVVLLVLCSFIFSCKNKDSKSIEQESLSSNTQKVLTDTNTKIKTLPPLPETTPVDKLPEEFYLKIVKPKNIEFKYHISELNKPGIKDSKRLHCSLTNLNDFPVYLLGYTCSDVPGQLIIEPNSIDYWQEVNCNISYAYIYKIEAKKDFTFSTNIRLQNESELKKLAIYVRFVNRDEEFEYIKEHEEILNNIFSVPYENQTFIQGVKK